MELPSPTPTQDHIEFDLLCLEVEEFGPLPSPPTVGPEPAQEGEEASLDSQILAGLVTP